MYKSGLLLSQLGDRGKRDNNIKALKHENLLMVEFTVFKLWHCMKQNVQSENNLPTFRLDALVIQSEARCQNMQVYVGKLFSDHKVVDRESSLHPQLRDVTS